jgi:hypothetical protein
MGMDITYQTKNIEIQNNYDSSKPGMYEYIIDLIQVVATMESLSLL